MSSISLIQPDRDLFSWPQYWAACFGPAPFLPMSREEMDQLGWDSCDIILVTGDAYVDHPSFGMAICGRMLEAQGFRVGIIAQPDWSSKDDFMRLGKPNLFFGGCMRELLSMFYERLLGPALSPLLFLCGGILLIRLRAFFLLHPLRTARQLVADMKKSGGAPFRALALYGLSVVSTRPTPSCLPR